MSIPKAWEYQLGNGLRVADTGFRLGGYASMKYNDPSGQDRKLVFDDLSLFVFGDITERIRLFSEWEDAHFFEIDANGRSRFTHHGQLERLYLDYLFSDTFKIRAGKFLTPVGTWNEIHADPLTWTVSRPLVTLLAFPEYTTGIQFYGDSTFDNEEFGYSIFFQNNESINETTGFRKTHLIYGGKIKWFGRSGLEAAIPLLYYTEYRTDNRIYLTGLDILYKKRWFEIMGEATYSRVDTRAGSDSKEYGYYLQGVYALTERLFLIGRHEYMNSRTDGGELRVITIGSAYKPVPQVVFKIEYQIRSGDLRFDDIDVDNGEQFLASFSILF
ncbi:MAG: outer membrane beta-barrel protein [Deltaproteobacteria bacterium]|nr:outer membrane beta-barrel protein [Deltaproteobacteria bacterium]